MTLETFWVWERDGWKGEWRRMRGKRLDRMGLLQNKGGRWKAGRRAGWRTELIQVTEGWQGHWRRGRGQISEGTEGCRGGDRGGERRDPRQPGGHLMEPGGTSQHTL